ncbi:hypothetical protein BDV11DRAFT_147193 [Aspergillus similis]
MQQFSKLVIAAVAEANNAGSLSSLPRRAAILWRRPEGRPILANRGRVEHPSLPLQEKELTFLNLFSICVFLFSLGFHSLPHLTLPASVRFPRLYVVESNRRVTTQYTFACLDSKPWWLHRKEPPRLFEPGSDRV